MSDNGVEKDPKLEIVTSGKQWRKAREEGFIIKLPSGNTVKIRPVPMDQLLKRGKIPDMLSPLAAKTLWSEIASNEIGESEELSGKYIELMDLIVPIATLEPKIVDNPVEDDEISLDDIDFMDKLAIFNLVIQPSEVLRRFRDNQIELMGSTLDGEDLRPETILDGGDSG